MIVKTEISWGYLPLIEIFAQANKLDFVLTPYFEAFEEAGKTIVSAREYVQIEYEDGSETDVAVTYLSYKHLGLQNMLHDYLIRCNIDPRMIPIGKAVMKRDPEQLEKEWQAHKKQIGLR